MFIFDKVLSKMENNKESTNQELSNKEKYQILINARNFHYENFNKWMTYFYVAIGALFIGYTNIDKDNTNIELPIILLGYIASIFWYWSSKGYYYWNISFINLVNYYEKEILKFPKESRIYFVFANKKIQNNYLDPTSGANISTSKVAILFAFIVTVFWGTILIGKLFEINSGNSCPTPVYYSILLSFLATLVISALIPKNFLYSKHEHFPDLKIKLEDLSEKENS